MYKHLYDIFKHWYCTDGQHQNAIWLFSDPHFNDGEMKYLRKNYIGDDEQIISLNKKIGKHDTLICLGDVGDLTFIKKLKGYKILIMGNHDKGQTTYLRKVEYKQIPVEKYLDGKSPNDICFDAMKAFPNDTEAQNKYEEEIYTAAYKKALSELRQTEDFIMLSKNINYEFHPPFMSWTAVYDNKLFDEVYEGPLTVGPKIILSHEPVEVKLNSTNDSILFNIHGHTHGKDSPGDKNHLDLCVEKINYTPVGLKSIIESGSLKDIPDIHRPTIDNAIEHKKKKKENLNDL